MSWYDKNDTFPVETSEGEKFVTKPSPRKPEEVVSMKKKLSEYLKKTGGMKNPLYRIMSIQSDLSQEIVDRQVECEALALYLLKHPDDEDGLPQHIDCINNLNCMKEKFMEQQKFTRENFPDFFPILYKRRGTMIKTPPQLDKSVCETLDSPEGSKRELEKWMSGIEYIGSKLTDIGEAGTEFIQNLVQKGMGGGDKVLTKKELDDLMSDVASVTILDDNSKDGEDDEHIYQVYGDLMMEKLAELEAKGIEIAHAQLEKAKPTIEKVQNIASLTGEKLKTLQEVNLIPTVEKTAHGLSNAESNLKVQSKNALEGVKDGLAIAGSAAKMATSKVKGESSILMSKLMSNSQRNVNNEEATEITDEHGQDHESDSSQGTLSTLIDHMIRPEYLPDHYGDTQPPSLLEILKDMGEHHEDGKDNISDEELIKSLKSLKKSTKKRAKDLHLSKDDIKQSADIVKGVMHALLSAASHGYGAAKDMTPQEIHKAKLVVDKLVNYATAEVLNKYDGIVEEKDEEEASSNKGYAEDNHFTINDLAQDGVIQEQVSKATKTDEVISENNNPTPTVSEDISLREKGDEEEASLGKGNAEDYHLMVKDLAEDGVTQEKVSKSPKKDEVTRVNNKTTPTLSEETSLRDEDDEEETSSDKDSTEDYNLANKDFAESGVTQEQVTKSTKTDEVTSDNNDTTSMVSEEINQTTTDTRGKTDENKPGDEKESNEENQEISTPEEDQDITE